MFLVQVLSGSCFGNIFLCFFVDLILFLLASEVSEAGEGAFWKLFLDEAV